MGERGVGWCVCVCWGGGSLGKWTQDQKARGLIPTASHANTLGRIHIPQCPASRERYLVERKRKKCTG